MNIGIIVHSNTGNTLSVAERLEKKLVSGGHSVTIERVTAIDEKNSNPSNIKLENSPDATKYDTVFFASPVQAFSLAPVMKVYMSQLPSLKGLKVSCFVTHHFPFPWLGGTRAIKQMRKILSSKTAKISKTAIIDWSSKKREDEIVDLVNNLCKI